MLIETLVTAKRPCTKTSMNSPRPISVNFHLLALFVRMIWRYSSHKNKSKKLNIYVKVRTETLICKLIILF